MTVATLLIAAPLAGCVTGSALVPLTGATRDIGDPPPYAQEVHTPPWRAGENAYVIAERERQGRIKANKINRCMLAEWRATRAGFAGVKPPADEDCTKLSASAGRKR